MGRGSGIRDRPRHAVKKLQYPPKTWEKILTSKNPKKLQHPLRICENHEFHFPEVVFLNMLLISKNIKQFFMCFFTITRWHHFWRANTRGHIMDAFNQSSLQLSITSRCVILHIMIQVKYFRWKLVTALLTYFNASKLFHLSALMFQNAQSCFLRIGLYIWCIKYPGNCLCMKWKLCGISNSHRMNDNAAILGTHHNNISNCEGETLPRTWWKITFGV